jgi:putative spermidine/putrescine transport system substrate-binding protein
MDRHSIGRRGFIGGTAALAAAAALPSLAGAETKPSTLVYSTYGGDYGKWLKESFEDPFTKATGVKMVHDIGENPARFAKLRTFRDKPKFQLIVLQDRYLYEAARDGLIEELDYSKIPNAADVHASHKKKDWLAYASLSIGLIYNKSTVKNPPRDWTDVLDERYKGRIFIDDFNHFGLHITVALALANGGSYQNIEPGLKIMREIKERLSPRFISTSQEGMKLLGSGEVDIAMWQNARAFILKRQGKPIEYVIPSTGDVLVLYGNGIVKNAGVREIGHQYLNVTVDPKRQGHFVSGVIPSEPANAKAEVTPETAALIKRPAGAKRIELDYAEVLPRLDDWTKLWNKMIAA